MTYKPHLNYEAHAKRLGEAFSEQCNFLIQMARTALPTFDMDESTIEDYANDYAYQEYEEDE